MTGQELRELRDAHHLTRKEMAAMLGYHPNYLARLEKGWENDKPLLITPRCEKVIRAIFSARKVQKSS